MSLDTLDLQDHNAPSAKDHTRQPTHPSPYGFGPAAPHQAQTLRHAEQDTYQQQRTNPGAHEDRLNGSLQTDQHFYDDLEDERDDGHTNSQNGANGIVYNGQDLDDGDGGDSHDEDLDDDLMDKISSSPSIEDGNYSLSLWPPRADSMGSGASPAPPSMPTRGIPLPSPFSSTPERFPLLPSQLLDSASHHGECPEYRQQAATRSFNPQQDPELPGGLSTLSGRGRALPQPGLPLSESQEFRRYLLPLDDPLLADAVVDCGEGLPFEGDDDWEDDESYLPAPDFSSDDDTDDFQFSHDERFIDSGWGGECLREIEDIDFEFVYALHTFVATVEGQANATKGDTMVLLDDSNSYWWLVRVVKDGSIG